MTFNKGFYCKDCGPIQKAKKRTIKKVQYNTCPTCHTIVDEWERPLNERDGRCGNCGYGSFKLAMTKGRLLRMCKQCSEVVDTDNKNKVVRKGNEVQ